MRDPLDKQSSEMQLVGKILGGEADLFAELLRPHQSALRGTAVRLVGNCQDADDVVQLAAWKAFSHLDQFQGGSSFRTWMTRVVINESLSYLRSQRRHPTVSLDALTAHRPRSVRREPVDPGEMPLEGLMREQARRRVMATLGGLPENLRTVVKLRDFEETSVEQTARLLGTTPMAVKVRHVRARRLLRQRLRNLPDGSA